MHALAPTADPYVTLVIPALNEAQNLVEILPAIPPTVSELIVVNGHSTDATVAVARRLAPGVKIVMQSGMGKGNALYCGFTASTGDIIVMMDADGSNDPREIPRFVEALLLGADIAKGSRFLDHGGSADITHLRHLGNSLLNALVNRLFQSTFTDLCYGYNALWRDALDFFDVDAQGFEVEVQIYLRARKANLKIVEVPSYERRRLHGASHLRTFRDGWRVLKMIWKEWARGYSDIKTPDMHRAARLEAAASQSATDPEPADQQIGAAP